MTRVELANVIGSVGLPTAYHNFTNATKKAPPYICYYYEDSNDLYADNINYAKIESVTIELYTKTKMVVLEDRLESILNTNGITYSKYETYIDDEQMLMVTYYAEVLING